MARDERPPAHPRRAQIEDGASCNRGPGKRQQHPFCRHPVAPGATAPRSVCGVRRSVLGRARLLGRGIVRCGVLAPSSRAITLSSPPRPRQSHHAAPQLPLPQQKGSSQPAPPSLHRPLGAARGRRGGSLVSCVLSRASAAPGPRLGLSGTPRRGVCAVCVARSGIWPNPTRARAWLVGWLVP